MVDSWGYTELSAGYHTRHAYTTHSWRRARSRCRHDRRPDPSRDARRAAGWRGASRRSAPGSRESRARAQFDWRSADAKGCFVRWVWSAAN